MTADTQGELIALAARANRLGDPCPPWCVTDHAATFDGEAGTVYHMDAHQAQRRRAEGTFSVGLCLPGFGGGGAASVSLDSLMVPVREAGSLADVLEALAGASPAQMRQLAALVRDAAAEAQ